MSQHNIVGSEAFNRTPPLMIRKVRTGGMRRRRARAVMIFAAGVGVTVVGGVVVVAAMLGSGLPV
ncbi:hypothetical protein IP78_12895 [Brevundimonas sp. AAP58]|uniref:hypothetical protein n=1 Tax=Brevundimonas sp. AAP58 TaxID=1523422 RepID=UPI0006B8F88A|nr:hypothetical protein [Brevundimonas sp. AAP58]KPF77107.1 hypothetical protein IP78_12895 [Brevundimonas sp. AAP58]